MKKKQQLNLKELKVPTKRFFDLLHRAITPLSKEEDQKEESRKSGENTSKRIHQRKAEDTED